MAFYKDEFAKMNLSSSGGKFQDEADYLRELEKIVELKTEELQHLLNSSEEDRISVLRNEHSRLVSEIIRLIRQKANLNKEITDLGNIKIAGVEMSIKDPRDIVKDILDKNSKAQESETPVFSDLEKANFRKEALILAHEAALKEGLFNMKWPVYLEPLPVEATREEKFKYQMAILSAQLQTLFTLANHNYGWIVSGKLKDTYE